MSKYRVMCIENAKQKNIDESALFLIQPLEAGHGITLGNALRRTLLSDLTGYAISAFRINGLQHEFSVVPSLREDIMEIVLNLKQLIFKPSSSFISGNTNADKKLKGLLNVKGPKVITASMLLLPYSSLTLLNPNQYICTIVDDSTLYLEIEIEKGKAYKLAEDAQNNATFQKIKGNIGETIFVDSLYSPIKNVSYKVKLINDSEGNIKESLLLNIATNGSITPKRALQESGKILLDLFAPLLINASLQSFSETLFDL